VSRLEPLEVGVAPLGFKILRSAEQHPGAGDIDVLEPAALKGHGGGAAGVQVSQCRFKIWHVAQHPVAFQADGQRVIVPF
jgi:hypothetical protein